MQIVQHVMQRAALAVKIIFIFTTNSVTKHALQAYSNPPQLANPANNHAKLAKHSPIIAHHALISLIAYLIITWIINATKMHVLIHITLVQLIIYVYNVKALAWIVIEVHVWLVELVIIIMVGFVCWNVGLVLGPILLLWFVLIVNPNVPVVVVLLFVCHVCHLIFYTTLLAYRHVH